ncbi:MAG: cation:dicarboxylase symporter family transporter, partial [Gammaproteobacteria bacterium]|nr:cation:dicarboxylase symporter family transporter [Gammaproteobacteria bacterium]
FYSLANNLVPAVVLFSIAIGVALIGVERKETALEIMAILLDALTRIANFVVRLTPIGVFAIMASAAGTLSFEEFRRLEVYIYSYIAISLVMSLWVLPGLVTTLTPLRYRDVVGNTKDALVTAFATGSLFVVLPILVEKSKEMIVRYAEDSKTGESAVEVIVPASFNFPHAGKLFTMSFVLFAGWFSGYEVEIRDYPVLIGSGITSLFANVNIAVPFMLDLVHVPEDMFQLFITTGVINARFATLLSAMFTLTLTLLGAFSMCGLLKISPPRVLRYIVLTVLLLAATVGGLRTLFSLTMENAYAKDKFISSMQLKETMVPETVYRSQPPTIELPPDGTRLDAIVERGFLRACYLENAIPISYTNSDDELVGLDIEYLHILAFDLKVSLELVPTTLTAINQHLNEGYCDIGTSQSMTPEGALNGAFSVPIRYTTFAL